MTRSWWIRRLVASTFQTTKKQLTGQRSVHSDDYRQVPQSYRQFPRLDFNGKPPVKSPNKIVFSEIVLSGKTHTKEVDPLYSKETGQPSIQVYEGARMAVTALTESISRGESVEDVATPELAQKLASVLHHEEVTKNADLIAMPEEDVLAAWVDNITLDPATGEYSALLVTYSFPGYGFVQRRLKDNVERTQEFKRGLQERAASANWNSPKEAGDDMAKTVADFEKTMFDPAPFFNRHPVILSNFKFVRRDGDWILDGLYMTDSKEVINQFSYLRWKNRIFMAQKFKRPFISALRYDYATDLFMISSFIAAFLALFVQSVVNPISHFRWRGRLALALKYQKTYLTALRLDYCTDTLILCFLVASMLTRIT